ncbi:hypothetical protein FS837_006582 [Tulasnella sp. UAMH 9824]|nr:hypothetical protein FS837_006582 [Tulasnella sp. UAMH 9824]
MSGAVLGAPAPQGGPIICPTAYTPGVEATTPGTPVYGLELTDSSGLATLTTNGLHSGWTFTNGGIAAFEGSSVETSYLAVHAVYKHLEGVARVEDYRSGYIILRSDVNLPGVSPSLGYNVLPSATDDSLGDIVISTCTKTVLYVNTTI